MISLRKVTDPTVLGALAIRGYMIEYFAENVRRLDTMLSLGQISFFEWWDEISFLTERAAVLINAKHLEQK